MAKDILQMLTKKNFNKGDILFQEGEQTSFFYIIESGDVEVFLRPQNQSKVVLNTLSAGDAIGEFAFITKKPRTASAQALTPVVAYEVSDEGYAQLMAELPTWSQGLITSLIQRLSDSTELIKKISTEQNLWADTLSTIQRTEY